MFHKLLSYILCLKDRQGEFCAFRSHNGNTAITQACQICRTVDKYTDTCSQKKKKCCLNVRTSVWMWIQILFQWLRSLLLLRWTGLYIVLNLGSKTNSKLAHFSIFIEFGSRLPPPPTPLQCRRVAFAIDAILYEEQTMKTNEQCKHYNKVFAMLVIEKWLQVVQKRV